MLTMKCSAAGLHERLHCECAYWDRLLCYKKRTDMVPAVPACNTAYCDQKECLPDSLFLQRSKLDVLVLVGLIVHRQVSIVVCKGYLYSVQCFSAQTYASGIQLLFS